MIEPPEKKKKKGVTMIDEDPKLCSIVSKK